MKIFRKQTRENEELDPAKLVYGQSVFVEGSNGRELRIASGPNGILRTLKEQQHFRDETRAQRNRQNGFTVYRKPREAHSLAW